MSAPRQPPPMRFLAVSLVLDGLKSVRLVVPVAVIFAVLGIPAATLVAITTPEQGPLPLPTPQVPLLSTTPSGPLQVFAASLPGKLPSPGPNQKRSGTCDPERAQVELSGGCWVATETPPPCPRAKQWEHEGKCWLPVAEAKPVPTSGEPRSAGVAEP